MDKKLNEVTAASDAAYIIGTTSSGETVRISKADLASVVGGLIGIGNTLRYTPIEDANYIGSGFCLSIESIRNVPYPYGMLISFSVSISMVAQLFMTTQNSIYSRQYSNGAWGEWWLV